MANPLLQTLLCLVGLQAATPPAPGGLLMIATLGTPCLPAAYAQIRFPSLQRWTVADSLGQATVSSVPDMEDATRTGRTMAGGRAPHAKLTWARVTEIRRRNPRIEQEIAGAGRELVLTRRSVFRILLRETWISPEERHTRVVRGPFCRAVARAVKGGLADTDTRRAS